MSDHTCGCLGNEIHMIALCTLPLAHFPSRICILLRNPAGCYGEGCRLACSRQLPLSCCAGLTPVDVAINNKQVAIVRRLEQGSAFAGWLSQKVTKYASELAGLGCSMGHLL